MTELDLEVSEVDEGVESQVKVYVDVTAEIKKEGTMLPQVITWETGERFTIDKVTEIRQAAAMKAGGQGDRYTVVIGGSKSYLFFERNASLSGNNIGRWFVERRKPKAYAVGEVHMSNGHDAQLYSDGTIRRDGKIIGKSSGRDRNAV